MTMSNDNRPTYAPGWYADVNAPGSERWFDGAGWTEHVRPAGGQTVATPAYATPATALAAPAAAGVPAAKRPWYKRKGIVIPAGIVAGLIVIGGVNGALGGGKDDSPVIADKPAASQAAVEEVAIVMVDVPDVVGMTGAKAESALADLGFDVDLGGGDATMPVTAQNVAGGEKAEEGSTVTLTLEEKPQMTIGQANALGSAEDYLSVMAFSRAGLIGQLTSDYGSGFTPEDAEFAVATLEQTGAVDWNVEAGEAAQQYLDTMSFSRDGLFQQLTSEYGSQFTPEQANAGLTAVGY